MLLTSEEKRTAWIAAGVGAAVLLIYFAGLPLWNRWTALGAALEPKVLLLERLEKRANAQNALIARRDSLARELGTVAGRPAPAGPDQSVPPAARPPAAEKPDQSKPAASGSTGPAAAPSAPGAPPAHAISVAAYVERQANTAKIRFNSLTPFTSGARLQGRQITDARRRRGDAGDDDACAPAAALCAGERRPADAGREAWKSIATSRKARTSRRRCTSSATRR